MTLSDRIVRAESGGDATAQNPNSSARGAGQFIDNTWLATIQAHRPDLIQGKTREEILAMRDDPKLSKEMTDAYAGDNQAVLRKAGLPVTDGTTYLAHFAGPGGAVKVLQADPNASAESVLGSAAVKANPFLKNMTAQDVQAWAAKKVTAAPTPGVRTAPTTTAGQQPIFAGQQPQTTQAPTQQPQALAQAASYAAPIFANQQPQAPAAAPATSFGAGPQQVNLQALQQHVARLRNSNPIFAGVPSLLQNQGNNR